jgi:hypothetical protein
MTTNRDHGAFRTALLAAETPAMGPLTAGPIGRPTCLSRRFYLISPADSGVTRRDPRGLPVAVGPYPGPRPACTVTPYREDRCLLMPRYAQPGRS